MANCSSDNDCGVGQLCVEALVSWNEIGENYCECDMFFGWHGEGCLELSARTIGLLLSGSVQISLALALAILLMRDLKQYLEFYVLALNSVTLTILSTCFGLWAFFAWRILYLLGLSQPEKGDRLVAGNDRSEDLTFSEMTRYLVFITQTMCYMSTMTVSTVWVEVAKAHRQRVPLVADTLKRFRWYVIGMFIFFVMGNLAVGILGRYDLIGALSLPPLIFLFFVFWRGRSQLVEILRETITFNENKMEDSLAAQASIVGDRGSSGSIARQALMNINRTALQVMISLGVFVFSSVTYWALYTFPEGGWKDYANPASLSPVVLCATVMTWCLLLLFASITFYTHTNVRSQVETQRWARRAIGSDVLGETVLGVTTKQSSVLN